MHRKGVVSVTKFCRRCDRETERTPTGICSPCNNAKAKAWRKKHPDDNKTRVAKWRAEDPKRARESENAWHARNADKVQAYRRQWYDKNADKIRAASKKWYVDNTDRAIETRMARRGWSRVRFDAAWEYQRGLCAICDVQMVRRGEPRAHRASCDHDHTTGAPRKLLCTKCNAGIGFFDDNPEVIRRAALYLESSHEF